MIGVGHLVRRLTSRDVNTSKCSRAVSQRNPVCSRLASFPSPLLPPIQRRATIMVTTPSIASDYEPKRQRLTLEKSKVVTVSTLLRPIICVFSDILPLFDIVLVSSSALLIALKATSDTPTVCAA
jgi:hypothetical protein